MLLLAAAVLWLGGAAAQTASELFARGSAAFERADYESALVAFEAARAAGQRSVAVDYNIAVCRYRLEQWSAAARDFAALAFEYPGMRSLASYNRGLALSRLGRDGEAREAFLAARAEADARLAPLIDAALARLEPGADTAGKVLGGYLDLGFGRDDNVALVDEASFAAGSAADSAFIELYGQLGGAFGERWRLDASTYLARYGDADEYDQGVLRLDAAYRADVGRWRIEAGPHLGHAALGGQTYEQRLGIGLRGETSLSANARLTVRLEHAAIDASERYAYIDGRRTFALGRYERQTRTGRWLADLSHEQNHRASNDVSPTRNRLAVTFRRPLAAGWFGELGYSYRRSRYDDASMPRDEALDVLTVSVGRELGRRWQWLGALALSHNDSDDARFDYRRARLTVSAGRPF